MLNTTVNKLTARTNISASPSGLMQKSNVNSWFVRLHQRSDSSNTLFRKDQKIDKIEVDVIQVMIIADGYLLAEVVEKGKI